jgi:type II secretory pathway component GspD/PulD (secretin)
MPKFPVPVASLFLAGVLALPGVRSAAADLDDAPGGSLAPDITAVPADEAAERARLRALPASHIPLKGASLASTIHLLAAAAQMPYLAPPDAEFSERITSDVTMNPFTLLQILGDNYSFGMEYRRGIWRFYRIDLNELVSKTYTLRFNNLQDVSITGSSINSQLAAASGGNNSGTAGSGAGTGGSGGMSGAGGGSKATLDAKASRILDDIKKIVQIPTVGVGTPTLDGSPTTPDAGSGRKPLDAPKIEPIWNPDTSQLFVVATRQQHSLIAAYLRAVDQRQKLVRISVKFVETSRNPQNTFGIDWSQTLFGSGGPVTLGGVAAAAAGSTATTTAGGAPGPLTTTINLAHPGHIQLPVALLSAPAFQWTLQAIASDQNSAVVQDPVIFTSNNREVTFKATTQEPIQQGSTTFGSATAATSSSIAYIEVGTQLTVLPSVMPGSGPRKEIVLLSLSIEVSSIIGQQLIGGNPYPVTSSRSYSYSVPIPSGETLAIAGLEQRTHDTSDNKLPLLGDIPVVGYLFKSKNDQVLHTTLLAFITPEVIADEGDAVAVHLPALRHRNFEGSATETLTQVDQSLQGLPEDIATLQGCATPDSKEAVLNRLDRIGVELALMEVRLGELRLTGDRLTAPLSLLVAQDREQLDGARAKVAQIGLQPAN